MTVVIDEEPTVVPAGSAAGAVALAAERRQGIDEVRRYQRARYITGGHAAWKLLGFRMNSCFPSVMRVTAHLPGDEGDEEDGEVDNDTVAESAGGVSWQSRYFHRPRGAEFNDLTLLQYYERYQPSAVAGAAGATTPRELPYQQQRGDTQAPQRYYVRKRRSERVVRLWRRQPSDGEVYFLRRLLGCTAARSFKDLLTCHGTTGAPVVCTSFREACARRGIVDYASEHRAVLDNAVRFEATPQELRELFVTVVLEGACGEQLFAETKHPLCRDYEDEPNAAGRTWGAIAKIFRARGRRMCDHGLAMQDPGHHQQAGSHCDSLLDTHRKLAVGADAAWLRARQAMEDRSPHEQLPFAEKVYAAAMGSYTGSKLFFLDGMAGSGKSFTISAILNRIRGQGGFAAVVAFTAAASAIHQQHAAMTCHRLFGLPLDVGLGPGDGSGGDIDPNGQRGRLLKSLTLLVVDEVKVACSGTAGT